MKIHILHHLRDEPWGGGNQFLKALRDAWIRQDVFASSAEEADVILINSYPFGAESLFDKLWQLKKRYPEKIVVYRLDGPISFIRQKDKEIDHIIHVWNQLIVDGIIFQSAWCEEKNREAFATVSAYQTVIHNAPDPTIFHTEDRLPTKKSRVKLIATSWSANPRKGFDVYKYLDAYLDFSKYEMTFVGNSPVSFKQIKTIPPVSSPELAKMLKAHDLFITASKTDPCSNSLIEAIACGLPAVALNDGGHPELIGQGGLLFEGTQDVLRVIDLVAKDLPTFRARLPSFNLSDIASRYFAFAERIVGERNEGRYVSKVVNKLGLTKIHGMILLWKIKNVWNTLTGSSI
ncbi:glycosyltransferase family 4 protein [Candidatus Uhrbacteria bacterium]|nr:glycosyltransferase family 4 protein [Candidatus Uhrbacteria bacterium]